MRFLRRGESASTLDLLVAGLGNPGREHARDRHNAGWMVVDELARRQGASFRSKFSGRLAETRLADAATTGLPVGRAAVRDVPGHERLPPTRRFVGALPTARRHRQSRRCGW